jgi:hypothetical protein
MMPSNSAIDGVLMVFKMTTSFSPTTMNCAPEASPSRFGTSSGMTTCP